MERENLIVSKYNEDIEYTFDDMLLDEKDETVESDIHIIDIFGKPYSIAMGNLHKPDEDETLGYFICYLLYEKQVVRKLGLYEISLASNEMASINHRTFDFEKEKLLLFDEYYEDITKLHPYMHKKENDEPEKTVITLNQNIKFEENIEKQREMIAELQSRINANKPEKTQEMINQYYIYIQNILLNLDQKKIQREIKSKFQGKTKIGHNFVKEKIQQNGKTKIIIDVKNSKVFENIVDPTVELDYYELILFEVLANVKVFVIQDNDFYFNFLKFKNNKDFSKLNSKPIYSEFDPQNLVFIHKSANNDGEESFRVLLYNEKIINPFEELDVELAKLISQKLNDDIDEISHPTRFKYIKSKIHEMENEEPEDTNEQKNGDDSESDKEINDNEEEDEEEEEENEEEEEENEEEEEENEEEKQETNSSGKINFFPKNASIKLI